MPSIAGFDWHVDGYWDDLRFPLVARSIDVASGRIDYDYAENTVTFATNARYTEEPVCFVVQLPHGWTEGSEIRPHLHWVQSEDADPNWLLAYRAYNNGADPTGAFTLAAPSTTRVFTYTSGSIMQITRWPAIDMTGLTVSCVVDFRLYRDTANESTLFSGADSYSVIAAAKEFDVHIKLDAFGSESEYAKQ